jgi:geranylgeranyl diphosphate synthase type I
MLSAIDRYAVCLGWIFQITDDYLGIFGNPDDTGKATMQDIRNGKNTLLLSEVKLSLSKTELRIFESLMGKKDLTTTEQETMVNLIHKSNAVSTVESKLNHYTNECYEAISKITTEPNARQLLGSFVMLAKNRKK